jgi:hypothetical protein
VRRRLLNLLTALPLLLCAVAVALAYSGEIYHFSHRPRWSFEGKQVRITIHRGIDRLWYGKVYWVLLFGLALPAGRVIRGRVRQLNTYFAGRRVVRGLCPECGYDVRATPDRCPECGRKAPGVG